LKEKRFYGWINLLGLMLVYGSLCGTATYAYGVFLPAMGETYAWSRSALSGPYALFFIIGGLLGPLAGMTIDRFGARKNIVACNLIVVIGLLGMSQVTAIWHIYLFFGTLAGIGIAFGEFIPITTVINNWFIRKRSLAMGLLFTSGGIGGFLMPPVISALIISYGWRWAWIGLAVIHLLLCVVMGGLIIRGRPEDIGQVPDGVAAGAHVHPGSSVPPVRVYQTARDWQLGEALRSQALWMIIGIFAIILFVLNMLSTHQVAYLQDLGFSPMASATALGMMLGFSIFGRLLSGLLGMRFEGRHLALFFLGCMGAGIVSLLHAGGMYAIYLYSALTGIGFGGMIVLMPNILGAFFGRTHYVRIIGWTTPVVTVVSAMSPNLAGALYDATGQYTVPYAISLILIIVGMVIAFLLRPGTAP
jgi:MFS family permease